jgi:hypothetical protein
LERQNTDGKKIQEGFKEGKAEPHKLGVTSRHYCDDCQSEWMQQATNPMAETR